jgi:hypothetical protein
MLHTPGKTATASVWYALFFITTACFANDGLRIFDWPTMVDTGVAGVTPVPHAIHSGADWKGLFDYQAQHHFPIGVMLRYTTQPYDGSRKWGLDSVCAYVEAKAETLSFVFADFESDTRDSNAAEMVNIVRSWGGKGIPRINDAYVGNYNDYPGATDSSQAWANFDRSSRHSFYTSSGLNCAQPSLYPYSVYRNHAVNASRFGTNLCVSIRHALFWTPIEKYCTAKRALPKGHILIPWIGAYVYSGDAYPADAPPKEDCRALVKHLRLRGSDGYYTFGFVAADTAHAQIPYKNRAEYRDDMYANGWKPLDDFFAVAGESEILNLSTNKRAGIEWSGVKRANRVMFIFSNFTGSAAQVDLPEIDGLPAQSPSIPAGEHLVKEYVVGASAIEKERGKLRATSIARIEIGRSHAEIALPRLDTESSLNVEIRDTRGRLLERLTARSAGDGVWKATWGGRGAAGRRVPFGAYLVSVNEGGHLFSSRLLTAWRHAQ